MRQSDTCVKIFFNISTLLILTVFFFFLAICSSPCVNGVCDSPNHCACPTGWEGSTCATGNKKNSSYFRCLFFFFCCSSSSSSSSFPSPLSFSSSFFFLLLFFLDGAAFSHLFFLVAICSSCVHGTCTSPETCSCSTGWSGPNCNTRKRVLYNKRMNREEKREEEYTQKLLFIHFSLAIVHYIIP